MQVECNQLAGWLTKTMTDSRPERVNGHNGTETRPVLLREAAVRNLGQWTKVWSSYSAWRMKLFGV